MIEHDLILAGSDAGNGVDVRRGVEWRIEDEAVAAGIRGASRCCGPSLLG